MGETNGGFDGSVIVIAGFVPCEVLALKSWMLYVTFPEANVIGSGVPLTPIICRSICELTVTDLVPELSAVFGSGSVPATVAVSVSEPPAVGVTTMVAKKLFDAGIEVQLQVIVPPD